MLIVFERNPNMKAIQEQAIRNFITLDRLHKVTFDRVAAKTRIHRGQHMALAIIAGKDEDTNQNALATELNVSPAAVAKTLRQLEKAGYVIRYHNPADRRNILVKITNSGKEVAKSLFDLFQTIDHRMFEGMNDELLESFNNAMVIMQNNLNKINEEEFKG